MCFCVCLDIKLLKLLFSNHVGIVPPPPYTNFLAITIYSKASCECMFYFNANHIIHVHEDCQHSCGDSLQGVITLHVMNPQRVMVVGCVM